MLCCKPAKKKIERQQGTAPTLEHIFGSGAFLRHVVRFEHIIYSTLICGWHLFNSLLFAARHAVIAMWLVYIYLRLGRGS